MADSHPFARPPGRCRLLLVLAAVFGGLGAAAPERAGEYQVKAAFIYNFTHFVEWPSAAAARKPIVIGVAGDDAFADVLGLTIEKKGVSDRIRVRRVGDGDDPRDCHLLYVSDTADRNGALLRRARGTAVLTVGESPAFFEDGGMIRFVLEGTRLRFQLNTAVAESAGFVLSPQLKMVAASR